MKKRILLLVCLGGAVLSAASYQRINDLSYRDDALVAEDPYARERCVLDLYVPTDTEGFATVVWFHGGGLAAGEKYVPGELMEQGIAVAAPGYRLTPGIEPQEAIEDAAAAVAWVFENIADYGGDPDKIFLSGHSAGGYLASMVGLDRSRLAEYGIDADRLAGLIPFSGHTVTHFAIRRERDGLPPHRVVVDEFAPLYHVRPDAPPMLLITGDREKELWGRTEENAFFMRMMKVAGHPDVRHYELDGYGHGMERPAYPLLLEEVRRIAGE